MRQKRIFPKARRSKYTYLTTYLARRAKYRNYITLSFKKIEEIIGDHLPPSAHNRKHWWSNTRNQSPSESWLTAGWSVENVDLDRKEITFKKDEPTMLRTAIKKRRRQRISPAFKALALKRRPRKPSSPSKTKLAMVQARARNVERRKTSIRTYRGKFKPKTAYEKRLYTSE
ncbi:MAG: hypothetical protein NWF14_09190 [Candidatus Bathyarchaeota archaeon]|nr:hypothetical protein [Candidatus Bathyarchaeota archaeon]